MPLRIRYRSEASRDLADLLTAVAAESPRGARTLRLAIDRTVRRIRDYPLSAPAFDPARSDVRIVPVRSMLSLIHLASRDEIVVLRALRAGRDIDAAYLRIFR